MTSNSPNCERFGEAPGETVQGQPATGRMPSSASAPAEGSVAGLQLPPDFRGAHFLDPAFLAGLANELFQEGLSASGLPGTPQAPATPKTPPRSIDWQDPALFLGVGEEFGSSVPDRPPGAVPTPGPGNETYYFLSHSSPENGSGLAPTQPSREEKREKCRRPFRLADAQPEVGETGPALPQSSRPFDVETIRRDFPILHQRVHGKPLIWLDNAATTQKPRSVIDAVSRFYERDNSNIHRAAHTLAARATDAYESAREKVRRFLGAGSVEEIIFVRGATEGVNLIAQTYGKKFVGKGDEIVLSEIEHHANIVPWQQLVRENGAVLRVVPVNDRGEVLLDAYEKLLGPRTRIVALTHVSNALGSVLPVRSMTQLAHRHGARVLIDGSQSVPHLAVDVQALDCDFFVFSGHKVFAPTGIGAVYGKKELLEVMPPWQTGGNMIEEVTFEQSTFQPPPARFEAGTGILAGAVGLGAAIDYLDQLGLENIARHEHELLEYGMEHLGRIPGLRLIGTARDKASVMSFVLEGVRTEDMGRYLDTEGIAVRAGHHCAQPTMKRFGVTGTVRPSLAFYNTREELDALVGAVRRARGLLG